jgi:hypothetical protein
MRDEQAETQAFDARLANAAGSAGLASGDPGDDALSRLKDKMAEQKAATQKQLAASAASKDPKVDK